MEYFLKHVIEKQQKEIKSLAELQKQQTEEIFKVKEQQRKQSKSSFAERNASLTRAFVEASAPSLDLFDTILPGAFPVHVVEKSQIPLNRRPQGSPNRNKTAQAARSVSDFGPQVKGMLKDSITSTAAKVMLAMTPDKIKQGIFKIAHDLKDGDIGLPPVDPSAILASARKQVQRSPLRNQSIPGTRHTSYATCIENMGPQETTDRIEIDSFVMDLDQDSEDEISPMQKLMSENELLKKKLRSLSAKDQEKDVLTMLKTQDERIHSLERGKRSDKLQRSASVGSKHDDKKSANGSKSDLLNWVHEQSKRAKSNIKKFGEVDVPTIAAISAAAAAHASLNAVKEAREQFEPIKRKEVVKEEKEARKYNAFDSGITTAHSSSDNVLQNIADKLNKKQGSPPFILLSKRLTSIRIPRL